jgi:hypothetical protein
MANQSSSPLGLPPTVWIVMVVGLAGAFVAHQRPFQDARPPDSTVPAYRHTPSEDQDVEARQWEDPLSAVAISRESDVSKPGAAPAPAGADTNAPHDMATLAGEVAFRTQDNTHVMVLGALVPGAPYADDVENRRRIRYAVLAGLFEQHFVPENNEHIGYVSIADFFAETPHPHEIAAYEWFNREEWFDKERSTSAEPRSRVLVLWLDQDGFRDYPLGRFSRIVTRLVSNDPCAFDAGPAVSAVMLGPADSDGLRSIRQELRQGDDERCKTLSASLREMSIYSPRATASDEWVLGYEDAADKIRHKHRRTLTEYFQHKFARLHLYRTIGTDSSVVQRIFDELKYRGVEHFDQIALIFERDTLYARLMSQYFHGCTGKTPFSDRGDDREDAPGGDDNDARGDTITNAGDTTQPLCFTYLKGLDGWAPPPPTGAATSSKSSASSSAGSSSSSNSASEPQEVATGPSQLDYLRRLASVLASHRHIRAIGVVGSDIYDKLLVLQAMRAALPRVILFTTDLDARLTDQQNLPSTRQLIVGASLGLSLRPELQLGIPPFRDGYQAATYVSTMLAIRRFLAQENSGSDAQTTAQNPAQGPPLGLEWTAKPRLFEIGRSRAFDLAAAELPAAESVCGLDTPCPSISEPRQPPPWSRLSLLSGVRTAAVSAVAASLFFWAALGTSWFRSLTACTATAKVPQMPRKKLLYGLITLTVITGLLVWAWWYLVVSVSQHGARMPPPVIGGESQFAGSLVEALSVLVVVTLVARGHRKLRDNAAEMLREFGFATTTDQLVKWRSDQLKQWTRRARLAEMFWFPLRRLSSTTGYELAGDKISELEALIAQYLHRGTTAARMLRVTIATFLATAVLLILESALVWFEFNLGTSIASNLAAGDTNSLLRLADGLSLLNLFMTQFLIFWVADAMLLTRSFALALANDDPKWPKNLLQAKCQILGLPADCAAMWMNLQLIAWRTSWVGSLIWYPAFVIAALAIAAVTVDFGGFGFASNPIALIISAGFVISAGVLLRRTAEWWRNRVLLRLKDARMCETGRPNQNSNRVTQLDRLVERVEDLHQGAFAPYSQQPLVRAVLLPALTYGATAALQYLHISE